MGSHFEKRIFTALLLGLLSFGSAHAAEDLVIRGDQSKPLLSEVPLPMKALPDWFFENQQNDTDAQLRELLADIEFFARAPETLSTQQKIQSTSKDQTTDKPTSTAADGATP